MEFIILLGAAALSLRVRDGLCHREHGPAAQLTALLSYGFVNFVILYLAMLPLGKVELIYAGGACTLVFTRLSLLALAVIAVLTGLVGAMLQTHAAFSLKITEDADHASRQAEDF